MCVLGGCVHMCMCATLYDCMCKQDREYEPILEEATYPKTICNM